MQAAAGCLRIEYLDQQSSLGISVRQTNQLFQDAQASGTHADDRHTLNVAHCMQGAHQRFDSKKKSATGSALPWAMAES
jgi:hypothetical protein